VSQCLSDTFDTEQTGKSHDKMPKTIKFMTALWRYQVSGVQSHISDPIVQFLTFINFLTKSWASGSVCSFYYIYLASALMSINCHSSDC